MRWGKIVRLLNYEVSSRSLAFADDSVLYETLGLAISVDVENTEANQQGTKPTLTFAS